MTRLDLATLWRDDAMAAFKGHSADVPSTRRLRFPPCTRTAPRHCGCPRHAGDQASTATCAA